MRICFLMPHHWSNALGGAELQVRYFIDYLRRKTEHEAVMICCDTNMASEYGVPIYRARPALPIRRYSLLSDYFSVRRLLNRLAPDVVYTRTSTPLVGFAARYCGSHRKTLVYHIAHLNDVEPPQEKGRRALLAGLERPVYDYGLRRADVIVAQGEYQRSALLKNYGLEASAIIPNFHPIGPEREHVFSEQKTVLWVANLKPAKRPELFIDLARRCAHLPHATFVMIGAIQHPRYLPIPKQTSGLKNFEYLGCQSIEEVHRRLASADLLVNTSRADGEGFPNTFIQAWLQSVPVISLDVDPDGVLETNGIGKCAGGNFDRLVSKIEELLLDDSKRMSTGARARAFASNRHGEDNCQRLLELLAEAYTRKRMQPRGPFDA